jgi:hypothetical protein
VAASSGGGADVAYFYDRSGNDTMVMSANPASGTIDFDSDIALGVNVTATGYPTYIAYSTTGGSDDVSLTGTAADDEVLSLPGLSRLRDTASTYLLYANSFEAVSADGAGSVTNDTALFYDSANDDTVEMGPAGVKINYNAPADPTGVDTTATGFELAYVYSVVSATDNDTATLLSSVFDDDFYGRPVVSHMGNTGNYLHYTHGFQTVTADAAIGGGTDTANLYDSDGADTYTFNQNSGSVAIRPDTPNTDVDIIFSGFRTVNAYADRLDGDDDTAYLNGTTAPDYLYAAGDLAIFRDTPNTDYYNYIRYFDEVYADPGDTEDGNDTLIQDPIDYNLYTDPGGGEKW